MKKNPYIINKNYFFRTATYHLTGQLVAVYDNELVINKAAWIADSGRFTQALSECNFKEVELFPVGNVIIGRGSLIDACIIKDLPSVQK